MGGSGSNARLIEGFSFTFPAVDGRILGSNLRGVAVFMVFCGSQGYTVPVVQGSWVLSAFNSSTQSSPAEV